MQFIIVIIIIIIIIIIRNNNNNNLIIMILIVVFVWTITSYFKEMIKAIFEMVNSSGVIVFSKTVQHCWIQRFIGLRTRE